MSHYPAWPRDALVSNQPGMSFPSLPGLRPQEVLKGLALPAVQREAPVLGGDGLGLMVCLGRIFRFSPPGTRCPFCLLAKFPECVCVHVCAHVGVRVCAVTSGHTTIRTRVGPPAPGSRGGYSPGPEPLSAQDPEHHKPESSREESKSRRLCPETQPSAPSARVPAPRPAHSGSGVGLRAQSPGRARGSTERDSPACHWGPGCSHRPGSCRWRSQSQPCGRGPPPGRFSRWPPGRTGAPSCKREWTLGPQSP